MTCHPHPTIDPLIYNLSHLLTSILKSTIYLHTLSPSPLQKTTRQSNPIQLRSIYAAYKQYQTNKTTTLQPSLSHQKTSSKKTPPQNLGATTPDTYIHTPAVFTSQSLPHTTPNYGPSHHHPALYTKTSTRSQTSLLPTKQLK